MARLISPGADPAHKETDRIIAGLEKKLKGVYAEAEKNASEKFSTYMAKFKIKDEAHIADVASGKWTQKQYEDWRKNQLLYANTLSEIRDTIAQDLHNADKIAIQMVRDKQPDVYALNHNYGTYEVEHGLGVDTTYTLYDHDTVERLIKDDPQLLPKPSPKKQKEIDAKDIAWNKQKLTSAFTASILSGDSIPKMAQKISEVAEMDNHAAIRNARTMCTGAENAGRINSYKRAQGMGIKMKQEWMATLDSRTRDSHRMVDGEIVEVGKKFSNGCRFPGDPEAPAREVYNCRCTMIAVVNGINPGAFDKTDTLRRKMENATITYEEWKHKKQKIKSITIDDFERLKGKNQKIKDDVIDATRKALENHHGMRLYDEIRSIKLPDNDKSVFRTNIEQNGYSIKSVLELNENRLGGLSEKEVDEVFKKANNTVCDSLDDAIVHETYHAKMAAKESFAAYCRISETESQSTLSKTAGLDELELISEIGVLKERGEYANVTAEDKAVFERYFPETKEH